MRPVSIIPVTGLPEVRAGDDLAALILEAGAGIEPGDVAVVAQKVVSKAEGRRFALADITPSAEAERLAGECAKDPRLVELVLRESSEIVRCKPGVLIARHRLGFVVANAAIDQSNVPGADHALLLPVDPDASAQRLAARFSAVAGGPVAVVINDSFGRPFREGTCGVAIGCAGLESLVDLRGGLDREGRVLQASVVAHADEIAAAGSLVMGQAAESVPVAILRGLSLGSQAKPASALVRPREFDLFR
ncbi:coenzyme F420-0:L-glutamate ligase [Novosphingobium sp. MW5]|nr:coenzyme F420-0:L-glutamate ligase [Novosphingobium sp. MW5]